MLEPELEPKIVRRLDLEPETELEIWSSNSTGLIFTYFKRLYFSHSSIIEFGRGDTIKHLLQESLGLCKPLLRGVHVNHITGVKSLP